MHARLHSAGDLARRPGIRLRARPRVQVQRLAGDRADHADHDLADELDWVDDVLAGLPPQDLPPVLPELVAVRELDLVRPDAWPRVLAALAADP